MKLAALIILLLSTEAFAQQVAAPTEKELKRQRERAQAFIIIEQTASEAPLWSDKKAAVTVLAEAADLSWEQSPASARKWLVKAWELVDSISEEPQTDSLKEFFTQSAKTELRSIVLRVAHSHDPKLADTFIQSMEDKTPEEKKDRGAFDDRSARSEQFLRLAKQAVETNPELAFALAQRSLADGLSYSLQNVLTSLRRKSTELSNRLFDLALARFSAGAPDPSEAEVLAGYLFQPGLTFSTNSAGLVILSMNPMQRNDPVVAQAEPQRARAFLVAAYQAFLARPVQIDTPEAKARAQKVWVFGMRNLSRYDTYATEFAGPARDYLTRLQSQIYPEGRGDPFSNNGQSGGDTTKARTDKEIYEDRIAELEDRADKENDPAARRQAYINAALAVDAKDYARAKRIAEKIADDDSRSDVVSYVLYRAALSFITGKDVDKATELANMQSNPQRRAMVRIAIAQNLLARQSGDQTQSGLLSSEQQQAFDLLSAVGRDMNKESPSSAAAKILFGRATLLARLDRDQALINLEDALAVINKLESFELGDVSPPKLGLKGSSRSEALLDTPRVGFGFRSVVQPLVINEFENLTNLAARFDKKELRGVGRFEVAKLYLQAIK